MGFSWVGIESWFYENLSQKYGGLVWFEGIWWNLGQKVKILKEQ